MDILKGKSDEYRSLYSQCMLVIHMRDKDHTINPVTRELMAMSLADFVYKSVDKFVKGQAEHGGNIKDRNLNMELRQEHIDSFWYFSAQDWPSHMR